MSTFAIVPAAGRGRRLGASEPKQYLKIDGIPLLVRTLQALAAFPSLAGFVIAVPPGDERRVEALLQEHGFAHRARVVAGGQDRQASVAVALAALPAECDVVLVHDAARPLVPMQVVADVAAAARDGAVTAAVPVQDTVKAVEAGVVVRTLDRSGLWAVQTPQGFPRKLITRAHIEARNERATDDCALVERLGEPVRVVMGAAENIKITTPADLKLAKVWLQQENASRSFPRIGLGYDVHRLVAGRPLVLGGVEIAHERGLLGHSDADVLVHACIDALLGAGGLGDIGQHFPDSDPTYAGVSSLVLLRQVVAELQAANLTVGGIDAVIIAEKPRVAHYIPTMRAHIADAAGVPATCVNVKATTNEQLGFLGRREGIAAQAVAWVK